MKKILSLITLGLLVNSFNSKAQTVTNAGMETWKSVTVFFTTTYKPTNWYTLDSFVTAIKVLQGKTYSGRVSESTTFKNSGTSSARLLTSDDDSVFTVLSNGNLNLDAATISKLTTGDLTSLKFQGGQPISKRVQFAHAYIHYVPKGTDTAVFSVSAFKTGFGAGGTDSIVGSGNITVSATTGFTKFTVPLSYVDPTIVPDRIVFLFNASNKLPLSDGTLMYVDDVTYSDPTGIEIPLVNDANVSVYPIPANDQLNILTPYNESLNISIYNTMGQNVLNNKFEMKASISLQNLQPGNYIYVVSNDKGHNYSSGQFLKK